MLTSHHLPLRATATAAALMLLISCGGGGDGGFVVPPIIPTPTPTPTPTPEPTPEPAPAPPPPPPAAEMRTIGGKLNGLGSGGRLVLQNNAGGDLALTANGEFSFSMQVTDGEPYAVMVGTNPLWQFCAVSNGSGVASASTPAVTVDCAAAQASVTTLAGSGTSGNADGEGTAAEFATPVGVALDKDGNLYVSQPNTNSLRRISPSGTVTTVVGAAAGLEAPYGLIVDGEGNLIVAEFNHRISKIAPDGTRTTVAGSSGSQGSDDGNGTAATFDGPSDVALSAEGNLYVAEFFGNRIRKIAPNGDVTTFAGSGTAGHTDGTGTSANFNGPGFIVSSGGGDLFVSDYSNHVIRKITSAGVVTTPYGMPTQAGSSDGVGTNARFNEPGGVARDAGGSLYVADAQNQTIRRITPDGTVSTLAGTVGVAGGMNGVGTAATFNIPAGLEVDALGNVYVVEAGGNRIRKITPTPAP